MVFSFALPVWGAYNDLEGLIKVYIEGPIFGIYGMYFQLQQKTHLIIIIIIIILVYSTFLQHKLNYKAGH